MKNEKKMGIVVVEKYEEYKKARNELHKMIDELDDDVVLLAISDILASIKGKDALEMVNDSIQRMKKEQELRKEEEKNK